jgi:hypothetical protein
MMEIYNVILEVRILLKERNTPILIVALSHLVITELWNKSQ